MYKMSDPAPKNYVLFFKVCKIIPSRLLEKNIVYKNIWKWLKLESKKIDHNYEHCWWQQFIEKWKKKKYQVIFDFKCL